MPKQYFITRQTHLQEKIYPLDVLALLEDASKIGFDFETTGLDVFLNEPVLLALQTDTGIRLVIDFTTYTCKQVGEALEPYIRGKLWIAHNAGFDVRFLFWNLGRAIDEMTLWCTMISSQVLYNGTELFHGYDDVVAFHFHEAVDKKEQKTFINRDMGKPITNEELEYVGRDVEFLIPLQEKQEGLLANKNLLRLIEEIENPLIAVLAEMSISGINLDQHKWLVNAVEFERKEQERYNYIKTVAKLVTGEVDLTKLHKPKAKKVIYTNALPSIFDEQQKLDSYSSDAIVSKFNPGSPAQVLYIFQRLGIKLTGTGKELVLAEIINWEEGVQRDFMSAILEWRTVEKERSVYGRSFLKYVHSTTGRIHGSFTQAFTDTGRLSSKEPNLQNIKKTKEIRACFIPDTVDHLFVTCDFSGQELRIAAAYSQDEILIKSFKEGLDLHSYLAQGSFRLVRGEPELVVSKEINEDLRDVHKRVLFGHIYGATAPRFAQVLNIPLSKAKLIVPWLRKAMPRLTWYQDKIKSEAVRLKVVYDGSDFNRRKLFKGFRAKAVPDAKIESEGANFPIQSTAANMSKQAMIETHRYIKRNGLHHRGGALKLAVHDELIFQLHKEDIEHGQKLKKIMVDVGTGYLRGVLEMESSITIADHWKK